MKKVFNFYLIGLLLSVLSLSSCSDNENYTPEFKLSLSADTLRLYVGDVAELSVKGLPNGATAQWTSSANDVAQVNNGVVTALKEGSSVVELTAKIGVASGHTKCLVVVSMRDKNSAIVFKDANIKKLILQKYPTIDINNDGEISAFEAEKVTILDLSLEDKSSAPASSVIRRIDGLEYFTNLETLNLRRQSVTNMALISQLTKLQNLNLGENDFETINLKPLTQLKDLRLYKNARLKVVDLSTNKALEQLYLQGTALQKLDLTGLDNLINVAANNCNLNKLICSNLPKLERLEVFKNKLSELTLTNLPSLREVHANTNSITDLKLSELPTLQRLNVYENSISSFSGNLPNLMFLFIYDNVLTSADFSKTPLLLMCMISGNKLKELDFSANNHLRSIEATNNPLLETINLKNGYYDEEAEYDIISGNTSLKTIKVDAGAEEAVVKKLYGISASVNVTSE
ncbi:MAG: Ig-like domain-containing protein [Prevotella sp.]